MLEFKYIDILKSNLILPYGLEPPRIMIKLVVNIHSAWILLKSPPSSYEKVKNQLASWKKTFGWSGTNLNQSLRVTDDGDESEKASIMNMEVDDDNENENQVDENVNFFVRVSFMGATVSLKL